ncbi:hypothetical protein PPYR_03038 [Photinus pyralis]|uniref:Serine protease K12H4.7 n=1 Tax=Photinus pyralis TaxID=7054 RepID=A0A5N4A1U7_PHOPY|nr:thymus-specific serine protease-like [Photinus pyralis]KAB0791238.1 hypothetical protein PPYR_03038 [Photinus pyralis]
MPRVPLALMAILGALQGAVVDQGEPFPVEDQWFEQYLDHFNPMDNRTFSLRYFENGEFYRPGGPILLEIGGEVTVEPSSMRSGPNYELGRRMGGMILLLEHRYYGKSDPFGENKTVDEYQYLTAEQALEDIAYFIESYKSKTPSFRQSKVAVFGCSYAGTLATWMRYKFPHLVDAAWASSAPLRITLDFYEYYEVAGELYSNVSSECIAIVRQGYREAKVLLATPEGLEQARATFEGWSCGNVTEMGSIEILATIRMVLSNQYNSPHYGRESCAFLQDKNSSTTCFEQLAAFVLMKDEEVCFDDDIGDVMAWSYQTCTQFGFSFTLSSMLQPFKDSESMIDVDMKFCSETFGDEFDIDQLQRSIARMNRVYGSTELKVTKVVTIQGTQDPWNKVGLQRQTQIDAPVFLVPGASHCADTYDNDYEQELPLLQQAKRLAYSLLIKWLQ